MDKLVEQFRKELLEVATFKDDTVKSYISILYKYFDYARSTLKIDPITSQTKHLRGWMAIKQKQSSANYLIQHRAALKHFYGFLVRIGVNHDNPAEALFPIRNKKSDRNQPIASDVAIKLLRSVDRKQWTGERNFMIISILWALGLRLNELVTLKVRDFEPNHDPANKTGLLRIHGKGDKERALFVVDKLYTNLVSYLKHSQSPKKKSEPLFPTQINKAISKDRVQRLLKESARKAGITQRITPHVLRHTFGTEMYHQRVPLDAIEVMLGHENEAETSIYIHVSDELEKQALENITIEGRMSWR